MPSIAAAARNFLADDWEGLINKNKNPKAIIQEENWAQLVLVWCKNAVTHSDTFMALVPMLCLGTSSQRTHKPVELKNIAVALLNSWK